MDSRRRLANHIRTMKGQGEIANDWTKLNSDYQLAILQLNTENVTTYIHVGTFSRMCMCVCACPFKYLWHSKYY